MTRPNTCPEGKCATIAPVHSRQNVGGLGPYDAMVVVSFGGPEGPDEVVPFLQRVTAGRGIPPERLVVVGEHYFARGGISPINDECRRFLVALRQAWARAGVDVPVWWGNRNSAPFLADTLQAMADAGHRRVLAWITSAYPGYSGCRQYRENLAAALTEVEGLTVDVVGPHADMPEFSELMGAGLARAVTQLRHEGMPETDIRVFFVSHSIPLGMNAASGPPDAPEAYTRTHEGVAELVEASSARHGVPVKAEMVWCSRSGPPTQPWLEPDILDAMSNAARQGAAGVVVVPIGFVADHMEVVHDLDTEAAAHAAQLGLAFRRVPTVRDDPAYAAGVVRVVQERADDIVSGRTRRRRRCGSLVDDEVPVVGCRQGCCTPTRGGPVAAVGEGSW